MQDHDVRLGSVRRYGTAPFSVAVIHGGPGAPGSVAAIARELSRERGILEPLQTARTLAGQVRELHDVLRREGIMPTTLIGHSWGAWLAFLLAAHNPQMVCKLILVSSGPFEEHYTEHLQDTRLSRLAPDERAHFAWLLERLDESEAADRDGLLAQLGALVEKTDNVDVVADPLDDHDRIAVAGGDLYHAVWTEAAELRRTGRLLAYAKEITCPIVAIHGDHDPHPAAGVRDPLQRVHPDVRFVLLRDCGHSPWKERHARDAFYAALRGELRRS